MMTIAASVTPNKTKFAPLLYPGEIEKAIPALKDLGYSAVEVSLRTSNDIPRSQLFGLLDKYGLDLVSVATGQSYLEDGYSLFSSSEESRTGAARRLCEHVDLAAERGACVIVGGIRGWVSDKGDATQLAAGCGALDECIDHAEKRRTVLLLEPLNRYETNVFNTIAEAAVFVRQRASNYLKILPDTFHMNIEEKDMVGALAEYGELVGGLHCADSNRLAPGMGHMDFESVLGLAATLPGLRYLGIEALPVPDSAACATCAINTIRDCMVAR